jgi:two-component system cell cycle sensor histidine kinase/response regulator CckA
MGRAMILLVDDDEAVRGVLARGLRAEGYRILEAADGQAALRILKRERERIHLVVTDLRMPRFDGYQLAEWMDAWDCQQPLIFITGHGEPDRSLPGPVLFKPVSIGDLVLQVRRSLRQVGIRPAGAGPVARG